MYNLLLGIDRAGMLTYLCQHAATKDIPIIIFYFAFPYGRSEIFCIHTWQTSLLLLIKLNSVVEYICYIGYHTPYMHAVCVYIYIYTHMYVPSLRASDKTTLTVYFGAQPHRNNGIWILTYVCSLLTQKDLLPLAEPGTIQNSMLHAVLFMTWRVY